MLKDSGISNHLCKLVNSFAMEGGKVIYDREEIPFVDGIEIKKLNLMYT